MKGARLRRPVGDAGEALFDQCAAGIGPTPEPPPLVRASDPYPPAVTATARAAPAYIAPLGSRRKSVLCARRRLLRFPPQRLDTDERRASSQYAGPATHDGDAPGFLSNQVRKAAPARTLKTDRDDQRASSMKLAVPDLISNSYFPAVAAAQLGIFREEGLDVAARDWSFRRPGLCGVARRRRRFCRRFGAFGARGVSAMAGRQSFCARKRRACTGSWSCIRTWARGAATSRQ